MNTARKHACCHSPKPNRRASRSALFDLHSRQSSRQQDLSTERVNLAGSLNRPLLIPQGLPNPIGRFGDPQENVEPLMIHLVRMSFP